MKKIYYAAVSGYILGAQRTKGERVGALSEGEAKYPVLSGLVTDKKPTTPAKEVTAPEVAPPTTRRKAG